jgi:hypothetical protein
VFLTSYQPFSPGDKLRIAGSVSLSGIKSKIFACQMEVVLEDGDDEGVVFALGQTGDGDRADAAGIREENREAAAVG